MDTDVNKPSWETLNSESDATKKVRRKQTMLKQRLNAAALDPENSDQLTQLKTLLKRKLPDIDWGK